MLKMLLGSTAETIFRSSKTPVLTVGPKVLAEAPATGPKRVLYATGFSAQSLYAGKFAVAIAERNQAQLALLHVVKEAPEEMARREALQHENEERLRHLVPLAASLPRAPELRVAFGPAAEAILGAAEAWHPDVIVLGLRRHSQETQQRTWMTAYNVVSNATCPVLTVRTPEDL